jgi:signal transduction histidine kinase
VIFDADGKPIDHRFVETNPAFEGQSGLKNALGRRAREILPDHEQHWFDIYGRIVKTGEPARFEEESEALGRWFDVHAMRVGAPEQNRVAILFNDITTRRKAETQLRHLNETLERRVIDAIAERKLLADIVEGTDAFVQVAGLDFRWLAINRSAADEFERIYGVRPSVGASMLDLLADKPEHRDAVRQVWSRALAGEAFTEVGEFGDPGRDRRCYEMTYNVLRDASGAMIGAYQFVYDVTERVREQRKLALAEEALRQSQKMEIIGQLTGGVAHDFNNLLMAVLSNLELLRKYAPDDPRLSRLIDGAAQGAQRGAALTQRLLAFARRQSLQVEPADIRTLVRGMRDLLARSVGDGFELVVNVKESLPPALVDPNQVELALLNLVVNARDAMPEGGAIVVEADAVQATGATDLADGDYVCLSVTDTGVGMDTETLKRAVEPFFSTKELGKGTGLGLSMTHGLASQLQGALRLTSAPGKGTRAELWLPVASGRTEASDKPDAGKTDPATFVRPLRILIVDDDPLILMSTADMLGDLGHEVLEAGSGSDALAILASSAEIDLLITDFSMPRMNGMQLAEAVRKTRPDMPILLATGYAEMPTDAKVDLPRLGKPYSQGQLALELGKLIGGGRQKSRS